MLRNARTHGSFLRLTQGRVTAATSTGQAVNFTSKYANILQGLKNKKRRIQNQQHTAKGCLVGRKNEIEAQPIAYVRVVARAATTVSAAVERTLRGLYV